MESEYNKLELYKLAFKAFIFNPKASYNAGYIKFEEVKAIFGMILDCKKQEISGTGFPRKIKNVLITIAEFKGFTSRTTKSWTSKTSNFRRIVWNPKFLVCVSIFFLFYFIFFC